MQSDHSHAATQHYATLRGALRVLSAAPEVVGSHDLDPRFREVRGWIQRGMDERTADDDVRAKIDDALAEIIAEMLTIIDRFSFWQLRAVLPTVRIESPGDVESLLQVCLSVPERRRFDLIDYLITLLATSDDRGRKQIERDPATISAYLQEVCAEAQQGAIEESHDLATTIDQAAEALASGEPVGEIVQRVRELKRAHEPLLLIPDVLKSVVAFNVAVSNRIIQQQEVRRSLDQAELDVIAESEQGDSRVSAEVTGSNDLPAFGSFELEPVVSALRIRLENGPVIDDTAHRVAGTAELSKLTVFEKDAFSDESDGRVSRIVRTVVTIGLVVRHVDEAADDLERLGIDSAWLSRSAAGEIDNLAQEGIRELTRDANFDHAQQLAELRARYLNPLFDKDLLTGPSTGAGDAVDRVAVESLDEPRRAPPASTSPPARSHAGARSGRRRNSASELKNGRSRSGFIAVGVSVVMAGLVGVVAIQRNGGPPTNAIHYTNEQLGEITPYLTRGYTSTQGVTTVFSGNVNAMWSRIATNLKEQRANEIGAQMEARGISVVKFHDFNDQLLFHYADGRVRHLE